MTHLRIVAILTGAAIAVAATPAFAVQCNHKGGFPGFLTDFKKEAERLKLTPDTITKLFGAPAEELTGDQLVDATERLRGSSYCVRWTLFPLDLTGGEKPSAAQMQTLRDEAKKLKVSPEKTAKLWLKTDLNELNGEAVDRIVAAMQTYQK